MRSEITRWAACLLGAACAALAAAAPAGAADRAYSTTFAWQTDPADGYAGWLFQEYDNTGPVAPGRYTGRTGNDPPYGRGLTITPTGNGGAVYPDQASGRFTYRTPGASPATQVSVRKVIYSGVTQKVADRQGVRLRLGDQTANATDDLNADGQTRTNATVTLPGMGFGPSSSEISAWMFSQPCQPSTATTCRTVDPANGGVNHVGAAELSLLDHEAPTITASGPAYDQRGRWIPETPAGVTVQAADPGSGIRSYTLKSTGPGGPRTVINHTITCDLKHTSTSSQQCPLNPAASTRDRGAIGALPTGITTFTAATRDLSGQVSRMLRWAVKIDRQSPSRPAAGKLTRLDGKFINVREKLVLPVASTDTHSGLRSLTAEVRDQTGSRLLDLKPSEVCTATAAQCPRIARGLVALDPATEPTGTSTVTLRATDLAGNSTTARPVRVRIDKEPPSPVKFRTEPGNRFFTAVSWSTPKDLGGSNIDHYEKRVVAVDGLGKPTASSQRSKFTLIRGDQRVELPVTGQAVQVRSVDGAGNPSQPTTSPVRPPEPFGGPIRPDLQASLVTKACKAVTLARGPARAALKAAGVPSGGLDAALDILIAICDFEGKAENELVKQVSKPIGFLCKKGGDICKKTIDTFCKLAGKTVCRLLKQAACFASDFDIFCTAAQKNEKRAKERAQRVRRRAVKFRTQQRTYKIGRSFGDSRYFARDARDRATGARGRLNARTVKHRRGPGKNEKRATVRDDEVTGLKPGCGLNKGHVLAGSLGGIRSDPRNFVPLPEAFNKGKMATLERQIAEAAEQGRELLVEVRPQYRRGESVPYRMDFRVRQTGGRGLNTNPYKLDRSLKVPRPPRRCR